MATLVAAVVAGAALPLSAADSQADDTAPADDSPVAATVNGHPLHVSQIEGPLAAVLAGRELSEEAQALLRAEALAQLIDRLLVTDALTADGKEVSAAEIDAEQEKLVRQLTAQKLTLEKFLADKHLTPAALRQQLAWQLVWERAMEKTLTDQVLEAYFKSHQKDFDGSQVRASHILLRPQKSGDQAAIPELVKQAAALREQIVAGKLTFADAAAQYSAGPSREKGGDVGFFPRHGLMLEPFSHAAFALEKGQVSPPVITMFGVHLIQPTDVKPGDKKWTDVREQLKPPAAQALYEKLASRERRKAKIEFTDAWPHFKPGTRELAKPGSGK